MLRIRHKLPYPRPDRSRPSINAVRHTTAVAQAWTRDVRQHSWGTAILTSSEARIVHMDSALGNLVSKSSTPTHDGVTVILAIG